MTAGLRLAPPPGPIAGPATRPDEPPLRLRHAVLAVPSLVAALAVLAGSVALSTPISGSEWVAPLVQVVGVIWLVGVGTRLLRTPAALSVLAQLVAAVLVVTALFTTSATAGFLPNGTVLEEARALLDGAWEQILVSVPPAPATPELSFLIAVAVGAAALVVDVLVAVTRTPALVALPLLCLYSVPASISGTMLPWPAFVLPGLCYALLLVVTGWGGRSAGLRPGLSLAAAAVPIAAVTAALAVVGAAGVTSVGTTGRLPKSEASAGVGLSPFASLHGDLQRSSPVDLLRVQGLPAPEYLRTVGLEVWDDDTGWSAGDLGDDPLPVGPELPGETTLQVTPAAYRDRFLPVYQGTSSLDGVGSGWFLDDTTGSIHRQDPVQLGTYQVTAALTKATADELRQDAVRGDTRLLDTGQLPAEVTELARSITAPATTAFDQADLLRRYFTDPANGFVYSLSVPTGNTGNALLDFLQNKQGYCEQYASAMAVMARAVGLPARVAVGFTQGEEQADGSYVVNRHDAHAWVEVRFAGAGWVRFDPTPLSGGQGGQQGFVDGPQDSESTSATPTATSAVVPTEVLDEPTAAAAPGATAVSSTSAAPGADGSGADGSSGLWWWLLAVVVVLGLLAGPTAVRYQQRRRRLAAADGPDPAVAAWAEVEAVAVDHGVVPGPSESVRSTANKLARDARLSNAAREQLRMVVLATERSWYSAGAGGGLATGAAGVGGVTGPADGSAAPGQPTGAGGTAVLDAPVADGTPATGLAAAVVAVTDGVRAGIPSTVLDRWFPRSVRPAAWR